MHLIRSGTVTALNLSDSIALYEQWLDYQVVETGTIDAALATSWGAPNTHGASYAVLQPQSGADIYLRLIAGDEVPGYVPLRTYGWAALEFCVQDVLAVNERMERSPFEVIGPPRKIEGLDAIHPMQVLGPNGEVCYFTQINDDMPDFRLPRAQSMIDHLFINVLAASDLAATQQWLVNDLGLAIGRANMEIVYTMLAKAFDTPMDQLYSISTIVHDKDVFLEVDQLPEAASVRPHHDGALPPGIGITTLKVPDINAVKAPFITPVARRSGPIYQDQLSGTVQDPDGTLIELVQI